MGCNRAFPKCTPHLHCIAPAARTPPSFFLPPLLKNVSLFALNICLLQKSSGRQLFGEEAVAGRICIGCADFIRKVGNAAFPWGRTRAYVPSALSRPTRRLNLARPATPVLESSAKLCEPSLRVDVYLPQKCLKVKFPFTSVPFEFNSFVILFNVSILIWILLT